MTIYIALLRRDAHSDYGIDFPDFPGCVTAGCTPDEAWSMAVEALELHVAGMHEDREPMPQPSTLEAVTADPHNRDATVVLVDVAPSPASLLRR